MFLTEILYSGVSFYKSYNYFVPDWYGKEISMKKLNKSVLYKFSSMCIALGGFIFYHGPCLMFFGEPEFKED